MTRVEMYVKRTCPYCVRAARLLDAKGIDYEVHDVGLDGAMRQEMVQRATGRTTVPQIFIGDRHIGGCDDLYALERAGSLDRLLSA